jgi:hypothetical protein
MFIYWQASAGHDTSFAVLLTCTSVHLQINPLLDDWDCKIEFSLLVVAHRQQRVFLRICIPNLLHDSALLSGIINIESPAHNVKQSADARNKGKQLWLVGKFASSASPHLSLSLSLTPASLQHSESQKM